jgi:hypothetical protein
MAKSLILVAALALAGCSAGVNYILENYRGQTPTIVWVGSESWRVFDHPRENKLMVTTSFGRAATDGYVRGATLGIVNPQAPKPLFQAPAERYLGKTNRAHCVVTDGYELVTTQYEFRFSCTVKDRSGKQTPSPHVKEPSGQYEPDVPPEAPVQQL